MTEASIHNPWRRAWLGAAMAAVLAATSMFVPAVAGVEIDATYDAQGPAPITGGQVESVTPNDEVAGAVHTIVAHPADPNILWIGTVNGGIWRTTNATAGSPTWIPLTDQQASLSIGALELDPTVATNTVLVAGIGRASAFGRVGGPLAGLLRTADGGTTWTSLGLADLFGENISGVAPRGNTIVVASSSRSNSFGPGQGGIFRSTDAGGNFTRLSGNGTSGLPNIGVLDLVGDPSNNARLYAGTQQGIFRSTDTGATWTNITNQVTGISNAATNNLELAVHNSGGTNAVYAGVINNGRLNGLWRSTDQGANWTQLDTPQTNEGGTIIGLQPREKPGGQGAIHFSIRADPTNANVVYVGGDRQPVGGNGNFPNSIGASDFSGRLFRCNASLAAGSQCTPLTHNGTSDNSAPHADSREMVFDANGDIIETDDGGVYRQTDPSTTNGEWQSLNGNLQVTEHHSCDYDSVGNIILCGDQDTGAPEQAASGSRSWITLTAGDGGFVAVNDSGANSIRFSSSNSISASSFRRRVCTAANVCVNSAPGFNVVGQGQTLQQFDAGLPLYTPLVINKIDQARFIVTSNRVYESTDSLDNLNIIVNSLGNDGNGNPIGTTRAIAYGGRAGGADNPGVLWFADSQGALFLRSAGAGAPVALPGWTAGVASDIVLNPENWADAYVSTGARIYHTTDAGATFTEITGNLGTEAPNANVWSLEIVPVPGMDVLALFAGTETGVFMTQTQNLGVWAELGAGLPNTIASDLHFDAADDVLLVPTMGRGSWLVQDISDVIPIADVRVTKSDSPDPVIAGEELFYTVTVSNDGPDEAVGVVVVDDLPDEVQFLDVEEADPGIDCTYDSSTHRVTCTAGDLANGESTSFVIKTRVLSDTVEAENDGTLRIENAVSASAASVDDDLSNNSDTEQTFVQERADLKVSKVCKPDDELPAGETGVCTIYVDNLGPSSARDVVLTDANLSDGGFTIGDITASQGTCAAPVNGVVTCQLGDLAAASPTETGRATVAIEVSATEDVDINDVATVTSPTPDPDGSNNQATETISVMAVSDLSVTKTGPATAVAGTDITYALTLTNGGPSTARGVVIDDWLSAGVQILSVSTGGGAATCNAGVPGDADRPTTCSFGTLAPGANRTMTISVHILPEFLGALHNDARVTSPTFDGDLADNLDTVVTDVTASADLSIVKSDSPDPVLAGNLLTYTLVITNGGPSTAIDVSIEDDLPAGTVFMDGVDGNGATVCALVQPDSVVCDLGDMAPGTSQTVYITVEVDPSLPDTTVLSNTATVSSATPDPDPTDNSDTEATNVDTAADLWIDKQATQRSGNPAPVVTYTLVVHNDTGCETDAQSTPTPNCGTGGPSDARNVVVVDTLPLTYKKFVVQYVSPQCTYSKATHKVTCTSATLPAGASVTFVIEGQVNGSVGTILNSATVSSSTPDPTPGNNTNAASIVVKGGTGRK